MTEQGWWKVDFTITIEGEEKRFADLDEAQQEHILQKVKEGYKEGQLIIEQDYSGIIKGHSVDVYDNDGDSFDRYTIVIDDDNCNCIGMSEDPLSPLGFNQYVGNVDQGFLDTEKHLNHIPTCLLKAIENRID